MATPHQFSGRCLCGAVTLTGQTPRNEVGVCHCGMCQRWAAGPFLALECEPGTLKISGEEHLGVYQSSEWGERCFCKRCGSPLLWRSTDGSHIAVSAGTLGDTSALTLTSQIFVDEKPSYYSFENKTAMMTGPEFIAMITAGDKKG